MNIPRNYFEKVYSGWLGKIIGIRLGAAIEGWSYERIKNVYGELTSYPVNYKEFAADDDSNGPIFFIRGLGDCGDVKSFSSQDVADALLNYAPFEHGFFWWGGYGTSTEHTAYLNLRNGIPAPRSGSIEQNGAMVAEQIGGQIFIDPWGLVAPGNPKLAAELAEKAAGVTHGGNGVYGGIFVACCISLAFVETDIPTILTKALTYIPDDCEYARVTQAVTAFHHAHPENWRECFNYLHENFGYDKYPGNCHIIPNAGVMILAMLYGGGDFENTINICNMCGWDTDCNVGNVGCIMGVLVGVEGMNWDKWAKPINDFLACSSVVGSLNAMDIPFGASYYGKMAYRLSGEPIPERWKNILSDKIDSCHFEYPNSTHAIRGRVEGDFHIRNTDEEAHTGERALKISANGSFPGGESYFFKKTYYLPEDFHDSRYDPSMSPLVYPGQTLHLSVLPEWKETDINGYVQTYVRNGATKEIIRGERVSVTERQWMELSMKIPANIDGYVDEVGVIVCDKTHASLSFYLDDLYVDGSPEYRLDFSKIKDEAWNGIHREVSQFSRLKGLSYLDGKYLSLSCSDFGEMYTGHYNWENYAFTATLKPITGENHYVNFRVQGAMRSYAVGFSGKDTITLQKNKSGYQILQRENFSWEYGKEYEISIMAENNRITVWVDGKELMHYQDENSPILSGAIGLSVRGGSHCLYRDFIVKG